MVEILTHELNKGKTTTDCPACVGRDSCPVGTPFWRTGMAYACITPERFREGFMAVNPIKERKHRKMKKLISKVLVIMVVMVFAGSAMAASELIVLQGQVTEDSQILDDEGNVFDIADTEKGNELIENVGQKVEIEGTVMEEEGGKVLTVESLRIVE